MKNIIILYFVFISNIAIAQSKWVLGTHIGVNSSDIAFGYRIKDWSLEYNATTMSYGFSTKYAFNNHWAIRLELNREQRGWSMPYNFYVYEDTLLIRVVKTMADFRYYFTMVPLMIDYSIGRRTRFYMSLGAALMLQTAGTKLIRGTDVEWAYSLYQPSRMNGIIQWGGLANIGYRYPIREKINIYAESRFNLSFNYYEGWSKGHHYAYGAIMGITYRL